MTPLYLRADTEADLRAACPFLLDDEGNWHKDTAQFSFAIIGPIPPLYATDETGEPGEMLKAGDGRFHANLLVVDPAIIDLIPAELLINPEPDSPVMGWA